MRAVLFLVAAMCLASAPIARAQTASAPSLWTNAGGEPPEGAQPRMLSGEHGVGDAIAEISLTPQRAGHLSADIALNDATNGALALPAGTPVRAFPVRLVATGSEGAHLIDAGAQWCTDTANPICISKPLPGEQASAQTIHYVEYEPGLARATGRRWNGPEPRIEETAPNATPLMRRLVIRSIAVGGVRLSVDQAAGDVIIPGAPRGLIPYGARMIDTNNEIGGIWYTFARVHRRDDTAAEHAVARVGLPRERPGRRG